MSDNSIYTTKEHREFAKAIKDMPFADMLWLAHQVVHAFDLDLDRDYEDVPSDEIVRMAKALGLAADNINEVGSGSE